MEETSAPTRQLKTLRNPAPCPIPDCILLSYWPKESHNPQAIAKLLVTLHHQTARPHCSRQHLGHEHGEIELVSN